MEQQNQDRSWVMWSMTLGCSFPLFNIRWRRACTHRKSGLTYTSHTGVMLFITRAVLHMTAHFVLFRTPQGHSLKFILNSSLFKVLSEELALCKHDLLSFCIFVLFSRQTPLYVLQVSDKLLSAVCFESTTDSRLYSHLKCKGKKREKT